MMDYQALTAAIHRQASYLCVGLDTDPSLIPPHLLDTPNPVLAFNEAIIEATAPYCVAYKINTAFYESQGVLGWENLRATRALIPKTHLAIADAKRGDIGNTSSQYARAFFEMMDFDAITVAPYMGADSVQPFLSYRDKWTIALALTSNAGSQDFQMQKMADGRYLYEHVVQQLTTWGDYRQMMLVLGATRSEQLAPLRALAPHHFFLVPGVGAQGGSLAEVSEAAMNDAVGLLVNASRSIIYADGSPHFAEAARTEAARIQAEMRGFLTKK